MLHQASIESSYLIDGKTHLAHLVACLESSAVLMKYLLTALAVLQAMQYSKHIAFVIATLYP